MHSYKTECPDCGGSNLYTTPHNGLAYCFNCSYWSAGKESSPITLTRCPRIDEIRDYYHRMSEYYHSCLDKRATNFLIGRGYTLQTIQQLKLGYIPKGGNILYTGDIPKLAGLATKNNTCVLADRIAFPYLCSGNIISDIRARSLDPNEELRYKSPYNSAYYRGADFPYNWHLQESFPKRVIITEGEIKSGVAYQYNYTIYGLPGMLSWRRGLRLSSDQKAIILFDSQKHDRDKIRAAITKAAAHIEEPYVATLPLFGKDKMDIDMLILEHGLDIFEYVLNSALPYEKWKSLQTF